MKEKKMEFSVNKTDLKKVLAAHKRFAMSGKNVENSPLAWIKFELKDEKLKLTTTDGFRLLVSELATLSSPEQNCEFCLSMVLASKLSFVKGSVDEIFIKYGDGFVEFVDYEFNSSQILAEKLNTQNFPNEKNLIPLKHNFTVCVSQQLIKDIAAMKAPQGYVELSFNTESNIEAILVEASSEEVSQKALLMPLDNRSIETEE